MPNVTWIDFEKNTSNPKTDFENLARIFFKIKFFNLDTVFSQSPNNAGVEIIPIRCGNNFISFQAKHFDNKVDYSQIKSSISKTTKYYNNTQLNIIYLICNKDVDQRCNSFLEIERIVTSAGMSLELICNNAILDEISINNDFENIKYCFFGSLKLDKRWFDDKLNIALEDLGGRYDKEFNVDVPLQRHFEFIFESNKMIEIIKEFLDSFKHECKRLYGLENTIKNKIIDLANSLSIPSRDNFSSVFNWKIIFKDIKENIEKTTKEAENKWNNNLKDDKSKDEYYSYSKANDIIETLNFEKSSYSNEYPFSVIENQVIFLIGDAGSGKSHLIGYEADIHKDENRIILLLGQKLISNSDPWTQIKGYLDITCGMQSFLNALECKGAIDNSVTTIMIDAINESAYHNVWKSYLNELVSCISKLKYVKLVCSIRTSYIDAIFDESIKWKIEHGEILKLKHNGFVMNSRNAICSFFSKYKIPIHIADYLPLEFSNPLLLKMFCQTYEVNMDVNKLSYTYMFTNLIEKENKWIKNKLEITGSMNYVQEIVDLLITKMIENQKTHVLRKNLVNLPDIQYKILNQMINGQIIYSFYDKYDHDEIIYFRYEKMGDYLIAKNIICQYNLQQLLIYVEAKLSILREYNEKQQKLLVENTDILDIEFSNNEGFITVGIAGAIFSLLDTESKNVFVDFFFKLDENKYQDVREIILEIIRSFTFMKNKMIKECQYSRIINTALEKFQDRRILEEHYNVLITNGGKINNDINSNFLTKRLKPMTIINRDFSWTIYINYEYDEDSRIRNIIENILDNNISTRKEEETFLLSQLLCWFLTSSNRVLRDKASRAIVKLLTNEIKILDRLYDIFLNVNDSYVVQRFLGCMYGAILKSKINAKNTESYISIINKIYENVFDKEEVIPDILLRDYARNIIEYAQYIGICLQFDINKCRPPYKSIPIPKVDIERIKKEYRFDDNGNERHRSALHTVEFSMSPDLYFEGVKLGYGDFGRYTFQSALGQFKDVNVANAYYYALDYIKNTIGFTDEFAQAEIDNLRFSYSRTEHNIERISKKYQWIAAYRIWALASDHHKYDTRYSDKSKKYSGPWEPYVRDFDPTLTISRNERIYDITDRIFNIPKKFSAWELDNENWIKRIDNIFDYEKFIKISDSQNEEWICLFFNQRSRSINNYENDHRKLWREARAFLVKQKNYSNYVKFLKNKFRSDEWLNNKCGSYTVFADEYIWAPAFKENFSNQFRSYEVETSEVVTKRVKNISTAIQKLLCEIEDRAILLTPLEVEPEYIDEKHMIITTILAKSAQCEYSWEEEYDYSKEGTIRYSMPCADIINHFNLKQKNNGIWYLNDEIVCLDLSLVKNTDSKSLYIKKDILNKFLQEKKYNIFWIGYGLKEDVKTTGIIHKPESKYADMSIFLYRDNDWELIKSGEQLRGN
jgi:hypothetical protein